MHLLNVVADFQLSNRDAFRERQSWNCSSSDTVQAATTALSEMVRKSSRLSVRNKEEIQI